MDRELLDSAQHKLRLARYHGATLLAVLAQHPPDDVENDLRIAMEAHLEGLAYAGTAAAEKTIRSLDPAAIGERVPIHVMIQTAVAGNRSPDVAAFARSFEGWWVGRGQRNRFAQAARDLRNDAAHATYTKTSNGPQWAMRIRGGRGAISLDDFAQGYLNELDSLQRLVNEAEQLAVAEARA